MTNPTKQLGLKIDVGSYRGTLQGVPRLVEILRRNRCEATFLFSLGRDRLGRDIGRRCAEILRGVRGEGHEAAVHCWKRTAWEGRAEKADAAWTERQMTLAIERHTEIFGEAPRGHGAPGWQMSPHALRLTQRLDFLWSSDSRGHEPYVPVCNGEIVLCPQLPTTLPTLDELIGRDGATEDDVDRRLLALTASSATPIQVFTLRAEIEGLNLAPVLEHLLTGWREQGYALSPLGRIREGLEVARLPRHEIVRGSVPGREGTLMLQGDEFLSHPSTHRADPTENTP